METLRHYFISNDLDDLESLERHLESLGISRSQIHVLSLDDAGIAQHKHLHAVQSLMKRDIVHCAGLGALTGLVLAVGIMLVTALTGLAASSLGWTPFVLLSVIVLGFCTWEGGLFGIQASNGRFKRFEQIISQNKHLFFVDTPGSQEDLLKAIVREHPGLEWAGVSPGTPGWVHSFKDRLRWFIDRNLLSQTQVN